MRRRRKVLSVGSLADDLVRRMDPRGERYKSRVIAAWPQVAGSEVDSHTQGFALRAGELIVYVDSPVWATELSLMSEDYRKRLNQEVGQDAVSAVRFRVSHTSKRGDARVPDEPAVGGSARARLEPLGDQEMAQIRYAAKDIQDPDLRAAAVRAMARRAERAKGSGKGSAGAPESDAEHPS